MRISKMPVASLILALLATVISPCLLQASWEYTDKNKEVIVFDWVKSGSLLQDEEKVFIKSFSEGYKNFSTKDLGVEDKLKFLKDAFSDVQSEFTNDKTVVLSAKKDGKVIGFASFKPTDKAKEMYVAQLAVDPEYWKSGIGKELVFGITKLQPDVQKLVAIGRRINTIGKNFFLKIGFTECPYMHPGYDAKKYAGYEYTVSKVN